jgi:hypothetical protein
MCACITCTASATCTAAPAASGTTIRISLAFAAFLPLHFFFGEFLPPSVLLPAAISSAAAFLACVDTNAHKSRVESSESVRESQNEVKMKKKGKREEIYVT